MFTIWCHGNLALNLQLVLIASRVPCFGVGPRCLSSNLCVALHHQTLVPTVGVWWSWGRPSGLLRLAPNPLQVSSSFSAALLPAPTLKHSQHTSLSILLRPPSRTFSSTSLQPAHMITCQPYTAWPPPFIYTLCSASTCTPICQQAGALLMALVASLFAAHSSGQELISSCCAVLAFIFVFPTFCLNYYSVCTTTV